MQQSLKIYLFIFAIVWLAGLTGSLSFPKETLTLFLAQYRSPFGNIFFDFATKLGEWYPILPVFAVLLYKKDWRNTLTFSVLIVGVLGLAGTLKDYFYHARPELYLKYNGDRLAELGSIPGVEFLSGNSSFPSGHTLLAFALYTAFCFYFQSHKWAFLWLIPAILVGISRMYLGQHFLEDVVFGGILGVLWALFVVFGANSSFFNKKQIQ
jgi:membrane-associated phospholipid phosphatase